MKITVIGSGGAFDLQTNSSFLISQDDTMEDSLLFDCGINVFAKLKKLGDKVIGSISNIYISHLDDDHVGSLRTLVYYRHYVLGLHTNVYYPDNIALQDFIWSNGGSLNKKFSGGKLVKADMIRLFKIPTQMSHLQGAEIGDFTVLPVIGYHHVPVCGLYVECGDSVCYISGDTKAYAPIEHLVRELTYTKYKLDVFKTRDPRVMIFHDWSTYNDASVNGHACLEDIEEHYSFDFIRAMNGYHNDINELEDKVFQF